MNTVVLKSDVQVLQKSVIDLLEEIGSLMRRASQALDLANTNGQYKQFEQEILDEAHKVKNLELRMAIVAPMSAGKSTIINSIVGHELLPSRACAMTTLPTEIIFDAERSEPSLELTPQLLDIVQDTLSLLKRKLREEDANWLQQQTATHPYLSHLLQEVGDMIGSPVQERVSGRDEVIETLARLNDILRLCYLISPLSNPLQALVDVPRIYTSFWRSSESTQSESLGNLVIVDTPGPNDPVVGAQLAQIVRGQLQRSSIVLIVLDFTALNNTAAEEIKQAVQSVIQIRGVENLYVLVNKVDQRKEGDPMTSERTRQFIEADLGLGNAGYKSHIFEIAARRAFSASSFLQELEQNLEVSPQAMRTARSLAQEVFGIDWEEELEEASSEDLKRKAERLWKKSGFAPFLEEAIGALMAEAAPRCMSGALTLAGDRLERLHNDVTLRSTAMNADEGKLRLEVGALKASLDRLEACRQTLRQVDTITKSLQRDLSLILEDLKSKAKVDLKNSFSEEEFQRKDLGENLKSSFKKIAAFIQQKEYKSEIEFDSYTEAASFANLATQYPRKKIEILLEDVRGQVEACIEKAQSDLVTLLKRETQPIIEQASQRLNTTFNINLTLPNPQIRATADFRKPRIKTDTRFVDQGYEEKTVKKRSFWNWLWVVPYEEKTQVRRPDRKCYVVSLQGIVDQTNELLELSIGKMKQEIESYLGEDFKQRIEEFFENLNQYLTSYQDSLKQAQHDQRLSLEQKGKLSEELRALGTESSIALNHIETNLKRTTSLVKD